MNKQRFFKRTIICISLLSIQFLFIGGCKYPHDCCIMPTAGFVQIEYIKISQANIFYLPENGLSFYSLDDLIDFLEKYKVKCVLFTGLHKEYANIGYSEIVDEIRKSNISVSFGTNGVVIPPPRR